MDIQKIISEHSDYNSENPYWIHLCQEIENKEVRQKLSDSLNEFFEKYGPDAGEDFASCSSCLMCRKSAERALKYAFRKNKKITSDIDLDSLIDGGWSMESDGRENDPVTGKLLHCIPINKSSVIDELECLKDQDKLYKYDWVWLDYVFNSYRETDKEITQLMEGIINKHHKSKNHKK